MVAVPAGEIPGAEVPVGGVEHDGPSPVEVVSRCGSNAVIRHLQMLCKYAHAGCGRTWTSQPTQYPRPGSAGHRQGGDGDTHARREVTHGFPFGSEQSVSAKGAQVTDAIHGAWFECSGVGSRGPGPGRRRRRACCRGRCRGPPGGGRAGRRRGRRCARPPRAVAGHSRSGPSRRRRRCLLLRGGGCGVLVARWADSVAGVAHRARSTRQGTRMRRIGSPILFCRRWIASGASAREMWSVMDGARSRRPLPASLISS